MSSQEGGAKLHLELHHPDSSLSKTQYRPSVKIIVQPCTKGFSLMRVCVCVCPSDVMSVTPSVYRWQERHAAAAVVIRHWTAHMCECALLLTVFTVTWLSRPPGLHRLESTPSAAARIPNQKKGDSLEKSFAIFFVFLCFCFCFFWEWLENFKGLSEWECSGQQIDGLV